MPALSLIDRLGLADEVLAMKTGGKTQAEIAAWVNAASRNESVTQASVSRWLSSRERKGKRAAAPAVLGVAAAELEAATETLEAIGRLKVDRGGLGDARFFLDAARQLVGDLRVIYVDGAAHPMLRAKALELALETVATGHRMAVDVLLVRAESSRGTG